MIILICTKLLKSNILEFNVIKLLTGSIPSSYWNVIGNSWWWILRASTDSLMSSPNHMFRSVCQATAEEILVPPAAPEIKRTSPLASANTTGHIDDRGRLPIRINIKNQSNNSILIGELNWTVSNAVQCFLLPYSLAKSE